ncbi:uncharacterized protein EKO05_0008561 [Ascochyta rabiei]|uniref:Uncharacterized protein n=1 Tax=Didymella rabiei TaxID=5454 RepID=A0A163MMP4_DIDRA|nr:uncharacterized protein EKO05_0008561 [Ascochyta rabiei]KZM28847.1 hypothetical protein ST47_g38 [Ascochyta rabiei]UPX18255.1 hypothetical protein EKO05_0008561 [Ascochyta rabiei]
MFARSTTNDEERQATIADSEEPEMRSAMKSNRDASPPALQIPYDLGETKGSLKLRFTTRLWPLSLFFNERTLPTDAQQLCFICIRGKEEDYAVQIPCFRPDGRRVRKEIKQENGSISQMTDSIKDAKFESDSTIYTKIVDMCYQEHGKWKRWLPFYGVVDAREVEFRYLGGTESANQFRVEILPLDLDDIQNSIDKKFAMLPSKLDYYNDNCCEPERNLHAQECSSIFEADSCIELQGVEASRRENNLLKVGLIRDCARDPAKAVRKDYNTLDGLALSRSVILKDYNPDPNQKVPAIEIVLGWQIDRIIGEMPVHMTQAWVIIAIIWIGVTVGGLAGDWSVSTALGQLLAASVALILTLTVDQAHTRKTRDGKTGTGNKRKS